MKVLLADDDQTSLRLTERIVAKWGYQTITANDGRQALDLMDQPSVPRIAILDWNMPEIDGLEVTRRIKKDKSLPFTYIIILTGNTRQDNMVQAFEAGIDDYIAKPFNPDELRARLAVANRFVEYDNTITQQAELLTRYAGEMHQLADERAQQLIHADRMATLGTMSAGIAHEINNPNAFISGNIQTIDRFWDVIHKTIQDALDKPQSNSEQLRFILNEMPNAIEGISDGVSRIAGIVKGLKAYARQDQATLKPIDINDCILHALRIAKPSTKNKVNIQTDLHPSLPQFNGNAQQIEQVIINLTVNAAQAMKITSNPMLTITTDMDQNNQIKITTADNGPGMPPDVVDKIFNPFFTTKPPGQGTGLGLSISQGIIHDHGGKIDVESHQNTGTTFTIQLPALVPETVQ